MSCGEGERWGGGLPECAFFGSSCVSLAKRQNHESSLGFLSIILILIGFSLGLLYL